MRAYRPPLEGRTDKLRLDFNENVVGVPNRVLRRLAALSADEVASYPDYQHFLGVLAAYLGRPPESIALTNATDEAIRSALDTFVERGSRVLIPVPTFAMFRFYTELAEATVVEIPFKSDLSFPQDALRAEVQQGAALVFVANPNNPTGTSPSLRGLEALIADYPETGFFVDEAYTHFLKRSALSLIDRYDNLLVSQTFSKAFGLAGLRLGYIVSQPQNIEQIRKCASPYSVNRAALAVAEEALRDDRYVLDYVEIIDQSRVWLSQALQKLGLPVVVGEANFVLVKFGARSRLIGDRLARDGILVRDRSIDHGLFGFTRITCGTLPHMQQVATAIERLLKRKALLFDIDGVLVDVSASYVETIRQTVLALTGESIEASVIDAYKRKGGFNNDWVLTAQLTRDRGYSISERVIIDTFQALYWGRQPDGEDGLRLHERLLITREALSALSKQYILGIVSGRPKDEADDVLSRFKVRDLFDAVVTMEDVGAKNGKPAPDGLLLALQQLDCYAGYYVGDSVDDMIAATTCGIVAIGVVAPGVDSHLACTRLLETGAAEVMKTINELGKVLRE